MVAGLQQYPVLNARLDTERQEIVQLDAINLGLAVQSERGLVVPAVLGAQSMTTAHARRRDPPGHRGRAGRPGDHRGADRRHVHAEQLRQLQRRRQRGDHQPSRRSRSSASAGSSTGRGSSTARSWSARSPSCRFVFDHRVCDGGTAAGFMRSVADAIENPASAIARL